MRLFDMGVVGVAAFIGISATDGKYNHLYGGDVFPTREICQNYRQICFPVVVPDYELSSANVIREAYEAEQLKKNPPPVVEHVPTIRETAVIRCARAKMMHLKSSTPDNRKIAYELCEKEVPDDGTKPANQP